MREAEVDVPELGRRLTLIRDHFFLTANAEEGYVCVGLREVDSAVQKGTPLNALVIPGSSRVVIEPARHVLTPHDFERRHEPVTQAASRIRDPLAAEALREPNMPGLRGVRGSLYEPSQSLPCPPLSGIGRSGGFPPRVQPYHVRALPSAPSVWQTGRPATRKLQW